MTVGERIKSRRLELDLNQNDLAVMMGLSDKSSISKIENSGNDVSMKKVQKIAPLLKCTPAYLMGWEENKGEAVPDIYDDYHLTGSEKALIDTYRNDPGIRDILDKLINYANSACINYKN